MNIIVIEDDSSIRENLQELLQAHQFTVRTYPNGLEGLDAIQEHSPDLVLCDIMTPKMDGDEVLRALKSCDRTANIPFIFLTAKADRADQRKGMELGADDYIVKPFTSQELLSAVNTRMQRHSSTQKGIQQAFYNKLNAFTRINSHEYNTPLNGIIGLTDVLIDQKGDLGKQEQAEIAKAIKTSAKRLYRTFRNFMLYMQLEREEQSTISTSTINRKWLEEIAKNTLMEKAVKLGRLADSHFESQLSFDFSMEVVENDLYYILEELMWNAFRFSKENTPVIVQLNEKVKGWTVCISNQTPANDFFEKAEPFRQLNRDDQEQQGSGLGLYLCKELAYRNHWVLSKTYRDGVCTVSLTVTH
ncbi:MAG: response regulator [Sphingobacteriaceae bacterium]